MKNTTITWGMVSIPVKIHPAVGEDDSFRLSAQHTVCSTRLERPYYCPTCNIQVEEGEVSRGFRISDQQVSQPLTDNEGVVLQAEDQTVEVQEFVIARAVDPLENFGKYYYLEPDGKRHQSYVLLRDLLAKGKLLGIVTVVLRTKKHVAFLAARGQLLVLILAKDPALVRSPEGFRINEQTMTEKELKAGMALLKYRRRPFSRERVGEYYQEIHQPARDLKERKEAAGMLSREPDVAESGEELMELLKESIIGHKRQGQRKKDRVKAT